MLILSAVVYGVPGQLRPFRVANCVEGDHVSSIVVNFVRVFAGRRRGAKVHRSI